MIPVGLSATRQEFLSPALLVANQDESISASAPSSDLVEVRYTKTAGRAVFAVQDIRKGTLIWHSDDLVLSVLLREYRREVCGQCFMYRWGRDLEVRDKAVGFAFCSKACQSKWREESSDVGVQAWTAVESFIRDRSKEDSEMVDIDLPRPERENINEAWQDVAAQAALIRTVRESEYRNACKERDALDRTKKHKKAIQNALQRPISPDVMSFCVNGIIRRYRKQEDWEKVLALAADQTPYHNMDDLRAFTRTYLHLLAILPLQLLPFTTMETILLLSSRDSHNSFGIRSLEDDGSEFFGYGCWPTASYFNHSCAPNVEKRRMERRWEFRAGKDISEDEELCITYLSGEERMLSREKRMSRLKKNWGFDCGCERCETR